jgi:ATP-binding cassette subfamily F protein uup
VGGYSDWLRQKPADRASAEALAPAMKPKVADAPAAVTSDKPKRKLSYKDARELEQLPARIEQLEAEIAKRADAMNDPSFYQQDNAAIQQANDALAKVQAELESAYARWAELEG